MNIKTKYMLGGFASAFVIGLATFNQVATQIKFTKKEKRELISVLDNLPFKLGINFNSTPNFFYKNLKSITVNINSDEFLDTNINESKLIANSIQKNIYKYIGYKYLRKIIVIVDNNSLCNNEIFTFYYHNFKLVGFDRKEIY